MDVIRWWTDARYREEADTPAAAEIRHPADLVDISDPVIDELTGVGSRRADLPGVACPERAARLAGLRP